MREASMWTNTRPRRGSIYTQQSLYGNKQTQNNSWQKCGFNEDTTRHRAHDFTLCLCCAGQLRRGIDSGSDTDQHCKKKKKAKVIVMAMSEVDLTAVETHSSQGSAVSWPLSQLALHSSHWSGAPPTSVTSRQVNRGVVGRGRVAWKFNSNVPVAEV